MSNSIHSHFCLFCVCVLLQNTFLILSAVISFPLTSISSPFLSRRKTTRIQIARCPPSCLPALGDDWHRVSFSVGQTDCNGPTRNSFSSFFFYVFLSFLHASRSKWAPLLTSEMLKTSLLIQDAEMNHSFDFNQIIYRLHGFNIFFKSF